MSQKKHSYHQIPVDITALPWYDIKNLLLKTYFKFGVIRTGNTVHYFSTINRRTVICTGFRMWIFCQFAAQSMNAIHLLPRIYQQTLIDKFRKAAKLPQCVQNIHKTMVLLQAKP